MYVYGSNKNNFVPMNLKYILELDADGKIVGGEWIEDSILAHPSFITVVTKRYLTTELFNGRLTWNRVKRLLDASVTGKPNVEMP